ncbi:hypothetical protein [Bradyrhizobium genosp. A]|uniref:hypothetical protein n=1 Tax=Bradyrhizobium genosp. A TaxID=83626 RepID=UPI003CF42A50
MPALISEDTQNRKASFQWNEDKPDFAFSVSFKNPDIPSVIAESLGDILGLGSHKQFACIDNFS